MVKSTFVLLLVVLLFPLIGSIHAFATEEKTPFLVFSEDYHDETITPLSARLMHRIQVQPLNLVTLLLFILAIVHSFFAQQFHFKARKQQRSPENLGFEGKKHSRKKKSTDFWTELLYFLGELEVVFGLWLIPLFIIFTIKYDWKTVLNYIDSHDYNEALFIMVALAVSSTYPIIKIAEKGLGQIAKIGGGTPLAWWITLMTIGPILGAILKESVAMTIIAVLLGRFFYVYRPAPSLAYATLGLLFTNVSVGGMLTNFSSPGIYIISEKWKWMTSDMLSMFGWRVLAGILLSNLLYFYLFRSELYALNASAAQHKTTIEQERPIPIWITAVHLLVLAWLIFMSQQTVIALGSFVLFLGFYQATAPYQRFMAFREPILIAFFLASLILMSGLQAWWVGPLLENLTSHAALFSSLAISSFANNTSLHILYTHFPNLSDSLKYALFCGTMAGGGLTLMANSPNLIAYALLGKYFHFELSFAKLLLAALGPTLIMVVMFLA